MGCGDKNRPRERERGWKGGFSIWSWGFSKRLTVAEKRREIFFLEASDKSRSIL